MTKCCWCCKAAEERGELDHVYGLNCPHPECDWCRDCMDTTGKVLPVDQWK